MTPVLTAADLAALQAAFARLGGGDGAGAEALLARLSAAGRQHPDALTVAGMAARARGDDAAARPLFEAALRAAPRHPGIWNSYARLLAALGDADAALAAFETATRLAPDSAPAWINLALAAVEAQRWDLAEPAVARALALAPRDAGAHVARGMVDSGRDDPAAAAAAFAAALAIDPGNVSARHNLAIAQRRLGKPEAALATLDHPAAATPESATLRGHILADVEHFDAAIAQYHAVIAAAPEQVEAHNALAHLLPQLGRGDEALDGYRGALARGAAPATWRAAIETAKSFGDGATMLHWAHAAEAAHGPTLDWTMGKVGALMLLGERRAAIDLARTAAAAFPASPGPPNFLAFLHLQDGDPAAAEPAALRAAELAPLDQAPWSLLTLIWRLTGDRREAWLIDYATMVAETEIGPPPGWRDLGSFLAALGETLGRLHITRREPAEQSLRGGTQTRGTLFDSIDPLLKGLQASLVTAAETWLAKLPAQPGHPFLGRNTGKTAIAGSWSVRLRHQGFHINHVHPQGWLSSAFYVSLPPEIGADSDAGKLIFGVPDARLGLDLPPRRVVTPQPGRLALFPSYVWHGTAPFESDTPRLTVAFDALPS